MPPNSHDEESSRPGTGPATSADLPDERHGQVAELQRERLALLEQVEEWLEKPLLVLSAFWLVLLVVELVWGLSPFLEGLGLVIWALFVADFVFRLALAPAKGAFFRRNWLTALSLLTPALRLLRVVSFLRVAQATRLTRGARLVRLLGGVNRALGNLRRLLGRRRLGLVLALTVIVVILGSAGIYALEGGSTGAGIQNFGEALWFTAMIITTLGSEYWPRTPEGRLLTFFLALYAFAIFGYLAGALASFFIGRDAQEQEGEVAGSAEVLAVKGELISLRQELADMSAKLDRLRLGPPSPRNETAPPD